VEPARNLGYFVFGEVPDTVMVLAAAIIVLSGLCAFYRDRIRPAKWRQAHRAAAR
jgi:drug/metabolite transporter (DMT)-like permease